MGGSCGGFGARVAVRGRAARVRLGSRRLNNYRDLYTWSGRPCALRRHGAVSQGQSQHVRGRPRPRPGSRARPPAAAIRSDVTLSLSAAANRTRPMQSALAAVLEGPTGAVGASTAAHDTSSAASKRWYPWAPLLRSRLRWTNPKKKSVSAREQRIERQSQQLEIAISGCRDPAGIA